MVMVCNYQSLALISFFSLFFLYHMISQVDISSSLDQFFLLIITFISFGIIFNEVCFWLFHLLFQSTVFYFLCQTYMMFSTLIL